MGNRITANSFFFICRNLTGSRVLALDYHSVRCCLFAGCLSSPVSFLLALSGTQTEGGGNW